MRRRSWGSRLHYEEAEVLRQAVRLAVHDQESPLSVPREEVLLGVLQVHFDFETTDLKIDGLVFLRIGLLQTGLRRRLNHVYLLGGVGNLLWLFLNPIQTVLAYGPKEVSAITFVGVENTRVLQYFNCMNSLHTNDISR